MKAFQSVLGTAGYLLEAIGVAVIIIGFILAVIAVPIAYGIVAGGLFAVLGGSEGSDAIRALIAAVVGFGFQYLFTRVFVVDLPGL